MNLYYFQRYIILRLKFSSKSGLSPLDLLAQSRICTYLLRTPSLPHFTLSVLRGWVLEHLGVLVFGLLNSTTPRHATRLRNTRYVSTPVPGSRFRERPRRRVFSRQLWYIECVDKPGFHTQHVSFVHAYENHDWINFRLINYLTISKISFQIGYFFFFFIPVKIFARYVWI